MIKQQSDTHKFPRLPIEENKNKAEEMRKLYAEILQLDNQRFLLTTAAVVVFTTVAGWVTTIVLRDGAVTSNTNLITTVFLPLASATLLWWILLALFYFQLSKAATIRWLAAYLLLQGSKWEWTWHVFRKDLLPSGPKARWNWYLFRENGKDSQPDKLPFYQIHRMTTQTFTTLMWAGAIYFFLLQTYMLFAARIFPGSETPATLPCWAATILLFLWVVLAALIYRSTLKVRQGTEEILATDEQAYMEVWAKAEQKGIEQREVWGGVAPSSDPKQLRQYSILKVLLGLLR